jgi:alpha/beta superfamily hydrolase
MQTANLSWQAKHNGITINVSMDIRVHPCESKTIVLIIPGVDGSVDGYDNKYITMAEKIVKEQHKAVVRISNDFISSFHWEDNLKHALEYIEDNALDICKNSDYTIEIIAHSAGASVAAWIAHEYRSIQKMVLINCAAKLQPERILDGLSQHKGDVTVVYGSKDPSKDFMQQLPTGTHHMIIEGADHFFSGSSLAEFINLVDLLKEES